MQMSFRIALALSLVASLLAAQDAPSVDSRLLEILKERGVINATEFAELKDLEAKLRAESDVDAKVESKINEMVARMAQDPPKVTYKPGGGWTWTTADGNFALTATGRIQVRFTNDWNEKEKPNNTEGQDSQNFAVQRARLTFKGFAFDPKLKYEIQMDVAGDTVTAGASTSGNRFTSLRTAFVEYDFDPAFTIAAGQLKNPYGRSSELTSSGGLEFVDRSMVAGVFEPTFFEPGMLIAGKFGGESKDFLEYDVGVYNGDGQNVANNDDGLSYTGRIAVSPWGQVPYTEADLRPEADRHAFKLTLGLNALYNQDNNGKFAFDTNPLTYEDDYRLGADLTMIWEGFYSQSEFHYRRDHDITERKIFGWFSQLGYAIIPEHLDVALRYSVADWDYQSSGVATLSAGNQADLPTALREYLFVVGYYWNGHAEKIQLDFGRVEDHRKGPDTSSKDNDEWRLRIQFQIIF